MCWQLLIYKGKLNHGNAKKMYQAQQDRLAKTCDGNGSDPEITVNSSSATSTVEVESASLTDETSIEEPVVEAPVEEPDADNKQLQLAEAQVISEGIGVPMAGPGPYGRQPG
ncbi:MAG: hypothetical protein PVF74_11645 [Anaerolineales bacterium]|jgi:hypothetical protein